jgi:tol-pal system protein YbgF
MESLMVEHEQIRQRQDDLHARMDQLARNLETLMQGIRADFQADLGQVIQQMNSVESALRGTETRIEQLRRYTPTPQPVPSAQDSAAMTVDPIGLYNGAITDYQQGRLDMARQGFAEYLRVFPDGPSASDSQYWMGIIAYDQGEYGQAVDLLGRVPARYPESSKAPLALRKIGDAYRAMGDSGSARDAYQELIERYPNSSEAEAARREIGN